MSDQAAAAPIPQTDPRAGYLEAQAEIDAAIGRVLASGQYILGPEVADATERRQRSDVQQQSRGTFKGHRGTCPS